MLMFRESEACGADFPIRPLAQQGSIRKLQTIFYGSV